MWPQSSIEVTFCCAILHSSSFNPHTWFLEHLAGWIRWLHRTLSRTSMKLIPWPGRAGIWTRNLNLLRRLQTVLLRSINCDKLICKLHWLYIYGWHGSMYELVWRAIWMTLFYIYSMQGLCQYGLLWILVELLSFSSKIMKVNPWLDLL